MTKFYKIADFNICIDSIYDFVHDYCQNYQTDESSEYSITIKTTENDIEFEREKSRKNDIAEGIAVRHFSNQYLESLAVYRKLCDKLAKKNCLLFHGCAVSAYGKAYLFTAKSGTGKTTHAKLWLEHFGSRAEIINGDKPIIKADDEGVKVYGTPWCGKEGFNKNKSATLKAICILNRDKTNHISEISAYDGYADLLRQCHRPANPKDLAVTLNTFDRILKNVKLYSLGCNMEPSAAIVAFNGMK